MIDISTIATQKTPAIAGPAAPAGAAGGFVQLLAAFLDGSTDPAADAPVDPAVAGKRHVLADDGKALPDDGDTDDSKTGDPALTWLPFAVPQPLPAPVAPPVPTASGAPFNAAAAEAAAPALLASQSAAPTDVLPDGQPGAPAPGALGEAVAAIASAAPDKGSATLLPPGAAVTLPSAPATASAHAPPDLADIAPTVAKPAAQAFAAAISAAADAPRTEREHDRDAQTGAASTAASPIDSLSRPIVQAVADAKHQALNLREDRGLQGMIDRIEILRDDANARDTRIRLTPDALGSVNVALRQDGDTIHIHFTAETQATRTLLLDAQPRLAELAEARGVKLGQASVDAGTGGGANPQPRPEAPRTPVSASAASEAPDSFSTDQRLA